MVLQAYILLYHLTPYFGAAIIELIKFWIQKGTHSCEEPWAIAASIKFR